MKTFAAVCAVVGLATPVAAQQPVPAPALPVAVPPVPAPMLVQPAMAQTAAVLPANTQVSLAMNDLITTKGKRWNEGDTFTLTVTHHVMLGDYVVIPRGSRGVGRITWLTNKGAFGKSGKMEIDLEYVEVAGRRIPITGHYRQEGEGNTVATVGTIVAVGIFAGFVTGKSGTIPAGRELLAHTTEDLPIAFSGPAPTPAAAPLPVAARSPAVTPRAIPATTDKRQTTARIRCETCH